jgi:hypothetical protein
MQLDEEAVERLFGLFYQYNISFILGTTGESASCRFQ